MSKVDLIIPTFNRPEFLKRILDYYDSYKVNFNIIIADSSSAPNKKLNKKIVSVYPKLKIRYLDKFSQKTVSHYKFSEMIKYAKSDYCVFCPDDDFIIPNGIKESVNFLEKNPDYSAAHGSYISFSILSGPFSQKQFLWRFIYPYESISSPNPTERLRRHLTNYYQVLWAVRRTKIVKECYKEFIKSEVDPILFGELLPDLLTLVFGKLKRLNVFYSARQIFSSSYDYWPSLIDSISDGRYYLEYEKFRTCLFKNLSNFSKEKVYEVIDSSMEIYLKASRQEHLAGKFYLILKHIPYSLIRIIRLIHIKYLFSKDKIDRTGSIDNPSSRYFKDFNNIRNLVLK